MEPVFSAILLLVVVAVTWCVAGEGAWGAGLTFLCVLFAGLLAMNFGSILSLPYERALPGSAAAGLARRAFAAVSLLP